MSFSRINSNKITFSHSPQLLLGISLRGEPPALTERRTVAAFRRSAAAAPCVKMCRAPANSHLLTAPRSYLQVTRFLSAERAQHVWLHLCRRRCDALVNATWSCLSCTTPPPKTTTLANANGHNAAVCNILNFLGNARDFSAAFCDLRVDLEPQVKAERRAHLPRDSPHFYAVRQTGATVV